MTISSGEVGSHLDSDVDVGSGAAEGIARAPVPPRGRSNAPVAVLLRDLVTGGSPRVAGVNVDHVRLLAELDEALPPVLVHRATMKVIDGEHRVQAALLNGAEHIHAEFFDGTPRECFIRAVESNVRNGLPLTLQDRRESARQIIDLYPEWSDRRIAATVGLSKNTVARVRERMGAPDTPRAFRVGADGRARPLSAVDGRIRAGEVLSQRPDASLREIAHAAGISVGTARDVRERVRQGRDPLPDGRPLAAGPASSAPSRTNPDLVDLASILDSLKRDPALKYTDEGRTLLRWLDSRLVRPEEIGLAGHVPPHRAAVIALVARACALRWEDIAASLDQLATDAGSSGRRRSSPIAHIADRSTASAV